MSVQPDRWSAHAELGVNLLRVGDIEGSRAALERAYSGDPFSATTVNTLRVLDKLKDFSAVRATKPDLLTLLDKKEADALRPYVEEVARNSIATFSRRYGFEPREPVTIELYPNHDDFAVRTAGLPGIGLLGVTFGYLVAMDSPSGRASGDFHWGSTLWHEMAHVFTLSVTDHRVPRWLSEGISVFEEWRTGPTPGIAVSSRALDVFRDGKFLPIATLDEGFIRPDYEDQIQVSYMQSGLICYFIEQKCGFDKLVALLRQFTRDTNTAAAVEATFKMPPADFDKEFNAFLKTRFKTILDEPQGMGNGDGQGARSRREEGLGRRHHAREARRGDLPGLHARRRAPICCSPVRTMKPASARMPSRPCRRYRELGRLGPGGAAQARSAGWTKPARRRRR